LSRRSIHIWTSGIRDDSGGIQAFSKYFVNAVAQSFPELLVRVFVKNEAPSDGDGLLDAQRVLLHCFERVPELLRTPAMAATGMAAALAERPVCLLSTHMHFLPALHQISCLSGARFAGILHGIEAWGDITLLRRHALGEADHLFAVSHFTRDRVILQHGVESARLNVLPNTFDAGRFQVGAKPVHLLQRYGLRPDQPVILTVSRLSESERYKGHDQMMLALPEIVRRFPDVRYIIGGEGAYRVELEQLAHEIGVADRVLFAGFVPREELPDYYRLCDLFAMPSTKEGFGIVFMEAMASGKPVIAGNEDGSVDALAGGRLGALVSPHSVEQISRAAVALLEGSHPNGLLHDPAALRAAVVMEFGWEAFRRNVETLVAPLVCAGRR
jgi:glycosyltransferase involved in cell wall biosynthesis